MTPVTGTREGFVTMTTPTLIKNVRDLWRGELFETARAEDEEAAVAFDTALTATLSRLHGLYEAAGRTATD